MSFVLLNKNVPLFFDLLQAIEYIYTKYFIRQTFKTENWANVVKKEIVFYLFFLETLEKYSWL
jgi:hypothetical protein